MKAFQKLVTIGVALALLGGCDGSQMQADNPPQPNFKSKVEVKEPLLAPVPPAPAPEYVAGMRSEEGKNVLSSRFGLFSAHLSKAGPEVEIELSRVPTIDVPGFSQVSRTGPRSFEQPLLDVLKEHPDFITPLEAVLRRALEDEFQGLSLTQKNKQALLNLRQTLVSRE
ncbi:MAG TPA: hypothetical protein EYO33_06390 [Phycisphaerales bacterium]|nr:hypothetical protein [Phycisphaerales bacterium]